MIDIARPGRCFANIGKGALQLTQEWNDGRAKRKHKRVSPIAVLLASSTGQPSDQTTCLPRPAHDPASFQGNAHLLAVIGSFASPSAAQCRESRGQA